MRKDSDFWEQTGGKDGAKKWAFDPSLIKLVGEQRIMSRHGNQSKCMVQIHFRDDINPRECHIYYAPELVDTMDKFWNECWAANWANKR